MSILQQIIIIIFSVALMFLIIELIRRRKLKEEYSVLWMLLGLGILLISISYGTIKNYASMIGITSTSSLLFYFNGLILFLMALLFTIKISHLSDNLKNICQEKALLEDRLRWMEGNVKFLKKQVRDNSNRDYNYKKKKSESFKNSRNHSNSNKNRNSR